MPKQRKIFARSFKSDLSLAEMFAKLNELGPWTWIERDSDRMGEYLSARVLPDPHGGFFKIFVEPEHFAVNVSLESDQSDAQDAFDDVVAALHDRVLPALGAREIAEVDDYE